MLMPKVVCLLMLLLLSCRSVSAEWHPRVLLIGDSWAASLVEKNRFGEKGSNSFEQVLGEYGFGDDPVLGYDTTRGGSSIDYWLGQTANIRHILRERPSIDVVYLFVGGIDIVRAMQVPESAEIKSRIAVSRLAELLDEILAEREDISVVLSSYDYIDVAEAGRVVPKPWAHLNQHMVNSALEWWGAKQSQLSTEKARVFFVNNLNVLGSTGSQNTVSRTCLLRTATQTLHTASMPPEFTLISEQPGNFWEFPLDLVRDFPGGFETAWHFDCEVEAVLPSTASAGDGIHLNPNAQRVILRHSMEQILAKLLLRGGSQNSGISN